MFLSYDWIVFKSWIDVMKLIGNINQGIGFVWGWMMFLMGDFMNVLVKDLNYIYKDVIVLLFDGLNM